VGRIGDVGLGKDWPWLFGVALLVGVALSIAAYAWGSGTATEALLSMALIALALAQAVGLVRSHLQNSDISGAIDNQAEITNSMINLSNENRRIAAESQNLARNVEQFRMDASTLNGQMAEGLAALRQGHESVAEDLKTIMVAQRDIQESLIEASQARVNQTALKEAIDREQQWMAQLTEAKSTQQFLEPEPEPVHEEPAKPDFEHSALGEALNLALEPIVDLYTSNTAHYRMVLGMTNEQGHDVAHDVFVHHAERMGLRPQLDQHVIEQTLALLGQLRLRDPALCIFVPVGAVTLSNADAIQNILTHIRALPLVAQGIVLDVGHSVLASLSDASIEGLATLARAGVALSLSQASISGVDLGSLNRLNVRYVSLAASSVGVGGVVSAGLPGFVQSARALRIQIIISQVGDPRHVNGLSRISRYASGPAFALPRKLKRTIPEQAAYTAAA
jgi:EAL domain-containing protein (putative c-di-GMP-specific phosphodiesterase class I)